MSKTTLAAILFIVGIYNVLFFAVYPLEIGQNFVFVTTGMVTLFWQFNTLRMFIKNPELDEVLTKTGNKGPLITTYFLVLIFLLIGHTGKHFLDGNAAFEAPWIQGFCYVLGVFFSKVFAFGRFREHRDERVLFYALISVWIAIPFAIQTSQFPAIATFTIFPGLGWITPSHFKER